MSDSTLTQAQELATGWIRHFSSADRSIKWLEIEREHTLWLDEHTLLVGRIDAQGETEDGDRFFADWKTISAKKKSRMGDVKAEYRLDPQMLTYGVLVQGSGEGLPPTKEGGSLARKSPRINNRFCVRWAMKTDPCLYFHEWYSYSEGEIKWWRNMLLNISAKIRADRVELKPFVTNLTNCLRYGQAYACPFLADGCSKQQWDHVGADMVPRGSHLEIEREYQAKALAGEPMPLILDATRIETWLECNEKYRKKYLEGWTDTPGEALAIGIEFHDILHAYYNKLKEGQNG